jgi:hypothetical protein
MAQRATATQAKPQELPRITGQGWRSMVAGGPVCRAFWVNSRSEPGAEHTVYVLASRLACDCPGSRFRGTCAHRLIVRKAPEAEALTVRKAEAFAEAEAELGYVLTAKGRKALQQWRDAQAAHPPMVRPSDTAPRRSPRAFSILK